MSRTYLRLLIVVLTLSLFVNGTQSPKSKTKTKKQKEIIVRKGPVDKNVFDRELVEDEPSPNDILVESGAYFEDTSNRLFEGISLGYVTPWNNHGYDVAKIWAKKFDIISPVWLHNLRKGENDYEMTGTHDIDPGWLADVRKAGNKNIQIIPRVIFDTFTEQDFSKLLSYESEQSAVSALIVKTCKQHKLDGIVLEVWPQLAGRLDDKNLYKLVIGIATAMKAKNLKLVLVIPPKRSETYELFSRKHFETLYDHVYAFSLMTYDFSSVHRPGANAPLHWMKSTVEHIVPETVRNYELKRKKILLGLNMYGNDYTPDGGGPIVGHQFLEFLKHLTSRLTLDEHDVENFFEVKTDTGRHYIFYPTLHSINERLKLARELGVGVSLWELGQGLDYFYDLF